MPKDRVLAAFAPFIYSCVQLWLWDVGHQVAPVLHQCNINVFKSSLQCIGRTWGAAEGLSLHSADILLYTLCRSRKVAAVFPNLRASVVSEPPAGFLQAISMQQLHAQRSSDIFLLADTCVFACVQVLAVGLIDWLHPRTIMIATLYDSMVICRAHPQAPASIASVFIAMVPWAETCVSICVQIQTVGPIHWLHPRAIMVSTLYDSIVICPGAPKRLLECLVFHKSLIRYVDPNPPEWYEQKLGAMSYSEQVRHQKVPLLMLHLHTPPSHAQSLHLQPCLRHALCCNLCCRQESSGMSLQRRWTGAYESHYECHVQPAPISLCLPALQSPEAAKVP